jgi:uncharacterized protein (TIGR00725 family)
VSALHIAVIGAGRATEAECDAAEQIGRRIGEAGAVLVCGGLGGVMEAACRGAKGAGGVTVGILPGPSRDAANHYVDVAIATALGEARNAVVVGTADAVVAVAGEFGTLSEIALALKAGKPVIGWHTWELSRPGGPVETTADAIEVADSPDGAAALALARGAAARPTA